MHKQVLRGPMLMPAYAARFACTGGDCPDTCCSGWRIDLDRATLLQYESSVDPDLAPLFRRHVLRHPDPAPPQACGFIQKLEGPCHYCPFLGPGGLCRIQERHGEDWLSDTCSDYPRRVVDVGDHLQLTLQLSCPESARLALLSEDAFELGSCEAAVRAAGAGRLEPREGLSLEAMVEVQAVVYRLLGARELDPSRRLAVLGLFCERLAERVRDGQADRLPALLGLLEAMVAEGGARIPLRPDPERVAARADFAWVFILGMRMSELPPLQRRVVDVVAAGLGIDAEGGREQGFHGRCAEGAARLSTALASAPFLLDHYLLNEALREVLPWAKGDPFQHYTQFLLRFTILRVMLCGRAAAREVPLAPADLAETVQVFCRRMQHGRKIVDLIRPEVIDGDWTSLRTLLTVV